MLAHRTEIGGYIPYGDFTDLKKLTLLNVGRTLVSGTVTTTTTTTTTTTLS